MTSEAVHIRRATARDAAPLLRLMHALAVFERYADTFGVDLNELLCRGLATEARPEFIALVAQAPHDATLCGYAVMLVTPFTYDLRPTVTLKELYVDVHHRREGVAEALLGGVKAWAQMLGAGRIRWQVLPDNEAAKQLYRRWGGQPDPVWESWEMQLPAQG